MPRHRDSKTDAIAKAMRAALPPGNGYEQLLCIGMDTQQHTHVRTMPEDTDISLMYTVVAKLLARDAARRRLSKSQMGTVLSLMNTMALEFYDTAVLMQDAEDQQIPEPKLADVEDALRELHSKGLTDRELSEAVGISPTRVRSWRQARNLKVNKARKPKEES